MEPVEINAGNWYLRAVRADERMDDRPSLAQLGETDDGYVGRVEQQWADDTRYAWAVCEPTTGEMLAEVALCPRTGAIDTRARPEHDEAAHAAAEAVTRFAASCGIADAHLRS
ncbi:hypothetical protein MCHIJ_50420 [Mycolicibacterium chitae]|uniref:Uncharacterized protein n=1 Tax=Mycolicibacterium chitae TaxID=1792 RepID=A0A448I9U6_MYCCI|nr:hypothetical protein [Mycolicibacterium chitae]MCV7105114.1 hypothetical protein [Mycolicibacterium chitae]BBZ05605.1 hypothetical protein MCHIJ_50420 [Mycolicibacterium chitae]VEG49217.1 Uncharacterised protein [Mycolicibacterium chitae]